jgi:hypothetical protein
MCCHLDVKEVIRSDSEDPLGLLSIWRLGLVFEHDTCEMNGCGGEFWRGGDREKAGLETRDARDNYIEWNVPKGGIVRSRDRENIVTGNELKNFSKLEASTRDHLGIVFFACRQ